MALNNTPSFTASANINVCCCVKIDPANDNQILPCAAATDYAFGISKRSAHDTPGLQGASQTVAAYAGQQCQIYGIGEVAPAIAGAAVTRGSWVVSDVNGHVVPTTAATTESIVGLALESAAAAGVEILIYIMPHRAGQY